MRSPSSLLLRRLPSAAPMDIKGVSLSAPKETVDLKNARQRNDFDS